ncbi:hypothetical protein C8J56DRAFT_968685 [Mycena floridula]|nr:hypothetical protein C8J56DRAFT_968685 [Mycena floridula]
MTRLRDEFLELKRYRNTIAAISTLPDDIISQIFLQYVLISDPWQGKWTKILFVCRDWVDLCMNFPKLWSFVPNTYDSRAIIWARRSQGHPLSCKLELPYRVEEDSPNHHKLFSSLMHRIRKQHVTGQRPQLNALFAAAELPILENLRVECDEESWTLPAYLFQGVAIRYRSLVLSDAYLSSITHFNSLENLRKPSLESSDDMGVLPTMKDLAHILQRSSRMEKLNIRRYIRQSADTFDNIFHPVALPQLKSLVLDLGMRLMKQIFDNLTIPASTRLGLWILSGTRSDFSTMLLVLSRHFRLPGAPRLRSVAFEYEYDSLKPGRFPFVFDAHTETSFIQPSIPGGAQFSLVVYPSSTRDWHHVLRDLFRILPFDPSRLSIDITQIMESGQVSEYSWRTIFEELSMPIELRIGGNDAMISMMKGLVLALKARASPRNSRYVQAAPPITSESPPTLHHLRIVVAIDPAKWSKDITRSQLETLQINRCDLLVDCVAEYQRIDVMNKPGREKFKRITVKRHRWKSLGSDGEGKGSERMAPVGASDEN